MVWKMSLAKKCRDFLYCYFLSGLFQLFMTAEEGLNVSLYVWLFSLPNVYLMLAFILCNLIPILYHNLAYQLPEILPTST